MVWIWSAVVMLVIIMVSILLRTLKVNIDVTGVCNRQERRIQMNMSLVGIRILQRDIGIFDDEKMAEQHFVRKCKDMIGGLERRKQTMKQIRIAELVWRTDVGTGNAVTTGLAAGGVWSMKGFVLGRLDSLCKMHTKPELAVTPDFQKKRFESYFCCIGTMTVGQAIRAYMHTPANGNDTKGDR